MFARDLEHVALVSTATKPESACRPTPPWRSRRSARRCRGAVIGAGTIVTGTRRALASLVPDEARRFIYIESQFLRSRESVVFTMAFPVIMILIFASIFTGEITDGVRFTQYFITGMIAPFTTRWTSISTPP